eukprot:gene624-615_t
MDAAYRRKLYSTVRVTPTNQDTAEKVLAAFVNSGPGCHFFREHDGEVLLSAIGINGEVRHLRVKTNHTKTNSNRLAAAAFQGTERKAAAAHVSIRCSLDFGDGAAAAAPVKKSRWLAVGAAAAAAAEVLEFSDMLELKQYYKKDKGKLSYRLTEEVDPATVKLPDPPRDRRASKSKSGKKSPDSSKGGGNGGRGGVGKSRSWLSSFKFGGKKGAAKDTAPTAAASGSLQQPRAINFKTGRSGRQIEFTAGRTTSPESAFNTAPSQTPTTIATPTTTATTAATTHGRSRVVASPPSSPEAAGAAASTTALAGDGVGIGSVDSRRSGRPAPHNNKHPMVSIPAGREVRVSTATPPTTASSTSVGTTRASLRERPGASGGHSESLKKVRSSGGFAAVFSQFQVIDGRSSTSTEDSVTRRTLQRHSSASPVSEVHAPPVSAPAEPAPVLEPADSNARKAHASTTPVVVRSSAETANYQFASATPVDEDDDLPAVLVQHGSGVDSSGMAAICATCEEDAATVKCNECKRVFCSDCDHQNHLKVGSSSTDDSNTTSAPPPTTPLSTATKLQPESATTISVGGLGATPSPVKRRSSIEYFMQLAAGSHSDHGGESDSSSGSEDDDYIDHDPESHTRSRASIIAIDEAEEDVRVATNARRSSDHSASIKKGAGTATLANLFASGGGGGGGGDVIPERKITARVKTGPVLQAAWQDRQKVTAKPTQRRGGRGGRGRGGRPRPGGKAITGPHGGIEL